MKRLKNGEKCPAPHCPGHDRKVDSFAHLWTCKQCKRAHHWGCSGTYDDQGICDDCWYQAQQIGTTAGAGPRGRFDHMEGGERTRMDADVNLFTTEGT